MLLLYFVLGYLILQQLWVVWLLVISPAPKLLASDQNKLRGTGVTFSEQRDEAAYTVSHTVEDGIERISYTPRQRKHATPILMAHGMWHAAWCWQPWQEILAENGWESIAYSLPGHGESALQNPLMACTLSYYLAFVRDEVNRLPVKPVLMGHSMGGALSQWYLRYVGEDPSTGSGPSLPAVVLVAPWVSHSTFADGLLSIFKLSPLECAQMTLTWNANPLVGTPQSAARLLITKDAVYTPEELHARLGGESCVVLYQHNPPFWKPAENVKTPMLLLAGELDAGFGVESLRKSAAHYGADFVVVPGAGHNLMMEKSYRETAESIDRWLKEKKIA